jgi:hypothetical protein
MLKMMIVFHCFPKPLFIQEKGNVKYLNKLSNSGELWRHMPDSFFEAIHVVPQKNIAANAIIGSPTAFILVEKAALF